MFSHNWGDGDGVLVDVFAQEVVSRVDVFGAFDCRSIVSYLECDAVVFIDYTWALNSDPNRPYEHVESDQLFDGQTQSHVLDLTCLSCHRWYWIAIHGCRW